MFPENYPKCLEAVSYQINDITGIFTRWNSHCNTIKDNPYFIENQLKNYVFFNYFNQSQAFPRPVSDLIRYIADCISVKWTDEQFIVSFKKIKKDEKYVQKFDTEKYFQLSDKTLISRSDAKLFLKNCLKFLKNQYNKIILNNFKNTNKILI